jgi:hypothetical protein
MTKVRTGKTFLLGLVLLSFTVFGITAIGLPRSATDRDNTGTTQGQKRYVESKRLHRAGLMNADALATERGGVETAQIHNLLLTLYLHLKAGDFKDLARLVDVLKLHGFLPSFDGG